MQVTIESIDGPRDLSDRAPIVVDLIREIPGPDRPDYWIAALTKPFSVVLDNHEKHITHLVITARWVGTSIRSGIQHTPVGIAYVTDQAVLTDQRLEFSKCKYVAIGTATDTSGGKPIIALKGVLAGRIGSLFGLGKKSD